MNKNLGWKVVVIVVTLLVFVYGIFGIPQSWTAKGLLASLGERIHLGLDLKGGTHLILQVQVNDAVNVDSDNALERLKAQLRSRKINYAEISKPDPRTTPTRSLLKVCPRNRVPACAPPWTTISPNTPSPRVRRIPGRWR